MSTLPRWSPDGVEMAGIKEGCAVPQQQRAIAGHGGSVFSSAQEIDIALAGEIEAMVIAADERDRRSG